ncbi:MAG: hypothetical protein MUF06_01545 [Pirellulaceae bacterium]|nr:hypothetical protein [Pirellulaceae bacterium]
MSRSVWPPLDPRSPGLVSQEYVMETDWYNRAEAIQQRITQLRDSL